MNAPQSIPAPDFGLPDEPQRDARGHVWRQDGWTPDRQRRFLAMVAEGHTVDDACWAVDLTPSSAYALRRRAGGAAFALGWQAATLLAREHIADALVARAIDGQTDTVTRADGSTVTRHRYDNRLASAMLTRLDRLADAGAQEGTHHAARMIAGDWEAYLDLVARDGGPARAGLFLTTHGEAAAGGDLAPIAALARADHYLRTGVATAAELDISDLDPAARASWTAEQWARAEAAGLLTLAPPPAPAADDLAEVDGTSPLSPLDGLDSPVWFDDDANEWRTNYPAPDDFFGFEDGSYRTENYERSLTEEEEDLVTRARNAFDPDPSNDARDRDEWFAALADLLACQAQEEADQAREEADHAPTEAVAERADAPPVDTP